MLKLQRTDLRTVSERHFPGFQKFLKLVIIFFVLPFTVLSQEDSLSAPGRDTIPPRNIMVGINIFRAAVGDLELTFIKRIGAKHLVGVSLGFDYNFPDTKLKQDEGSQFAKDSTGNDNEEWERYFWGEGAAVRLNFDFLYLSRKFKRERFVSIEALFKAHNYKNYFLRKNDFLYLENAEQRIAGLTILAGAHYNIGKILMARASFGIGGRFISSRITQPEYLLNNNLYPEIRRHKTFIYPSLHFGVAILFAK